MEPISFDRYKKSYVELTNRLGVLAVVMLFAQTAVNQAPYDLEITTPLEGSVGPGHASK